MRAIRPFSFLSKWGRHFVSEILCVLNGLWNADTFRGCAFKPADSSNYALMLLQFEYLLGNLSASPRRHLHTDVEGNRSEIFGINPCHQLRAEPLASPHAAQVPLEMVGWFLPGGEKRRIENCLQSSCSGPVVQSVISGLQVKNNTFMPVTRSGNQRLFWFYYKSVILLSVIYIYINYISVIDGDK